MGVRTRRALPGFRLSLGFALFYMTVLVIIPLGGCFLKAASLPPERLWQVISHPQAVAAYKLSLATSLIAGLINAFLGMMAAWVLVRYEFPGKKLLDMLVDLPLA